MDRKKAQITKGFITVAVNAGLFVVKLWAGSVTGSIALMADAWDTLSDSMIAVFIIIAAKLASKEPDKEHPFGHGRWELIVSIFMAFLLAMIGYEFLSRSIDSLQNRESVIFGTLAIVVTVTSIVVKELLAQYGFYLGRKYNNPVVKAEAWNARSDMFMSGVILVGIIVTKASGNLWWMDSILGIFCAVVIFYAAFKILKESITRMLGEEPDAEFLEKLDHEVSIIHERDLKMHHIHLHNYISQKELTLHIRLNKNMTIDEGHKIATDIEHMIKEKFEMVATIHVEPMESTKNPGNAQ